MIGTELENMLERAEIILAQVQQTNIHATARERDNLWGLWGMLSIQMVVLTTELRQAVERERKQSQDTIAAQIEIRALSRKRRQNSNNDRATGISKRGEL